MHYIPLGDTALRVSRLCLGCMTFGEPDRGRHAWTLPEESSRPLIQHAIEFSILLCCMHRLRVNICCVDFFSA